MKKYYIIYLILFFSFFQKIQAKIIGFRDDYPFVNHLKKDLEGMIEFVQSRSIMPNDSLQLVTNRRALLLLTPKYSNTIENIQVTGFYKGKVLGKFMMNSPSFFPATDQNTALENNLPRVKYSTKAWSIPLPASWIRHGLSLKFKDQKGRVGILDEEQFNFGAPSEIFLTNFRLGMLSKLREPEELELDPLNEANDFFQTVPVAKLKLGTFLPLEIKDKIVMPDGKIYTPDNLSDSLGGWEFGDMREEILKGLFGAGINRANYGIFSSIAMEQSYFNFNQMPIYGGTGSYKNGENINHGLSGGNGLATLDSTKGNEFSHELAHSFHVDHYHGGEKYNFHNEKSGWGYDANRNVMLGSLLWRKWSNKQYKVTWKNLYDFNAHPMAGAEENGNVSKYTQFTNYTSEIVQKDLAKYSVISKESPTGYMVWNEYFKQMIIQWKTNYPIPKYYDVPIMTLVGFYDPVGKLPSHIYPALYGNLGYVYPFEKEEKTGCWLSVHSSSGTENVKLEDYRFHNSKMNMFHINFLYENRDYYSAKIFCDINGEKKELSQINIESPSNELPIPVIISDIHEPQKKKLHRYLKLKLLNSHYINPDHSSHTSISEIDLIDKNNQKILKKKWSIKYVTSEENIRNFHAKNAIDKNPKTFWHTEYSNGWNNGKSIPFPHEITIDLGDYYDLKEYYLNVYQDKGYNNIKNYMISASSDFEDWEILAKGELQKFQDNNVINLNQYSEYYSENEDNKRRKREATEKNKLSENPLYSQNKKINKIGLTFKSQSDTISGYLFIGNSPEINLYQNGILDSDSNITFKIKQNPSCGRISIAESYGGFVYRKDLNKCYQMSYDMAVIEIKQEKNSIIKWIDLSVHFFTNRK